jgi:nitrogen fixation NifU-like protein
MSESLTELYQELILDHHKNPRCFGKLACFTHRALGHNPLCGDALDLTLYLNQDERVVDVRFTGESCAICKASASLMTESIVGKLKSEVLALHALFCETLTQERGPLHAEKNIQLGKLAALMGVRAFPVRVKCATLAWHTLQAALNQPTPSDDNIAQDDCIRVSTEAGSHHG